MMRRSLLDYVLGPSVRGIPPVDDGDRTLYLTFDDGPDARATPQVLAVLAAHGVPATFFLIAERAVAQPHVVAEMRAAGHAIGNHSLDHRYRTFFTTRRRMLAWITRAEARLHEVVAAPSVGFRPPSGIRTPELQWALKQLDLPLVLWGQRFFDTAHLWTQARALPSLVRTVPGTIVLLHDRQTPARMPEFLATLAAYITAARAVGFGFRALTREQCAAAMRQ